MAHIAPFKGSSGAEQGVYVHQATGFVIHEAYNVADLLRMNGVLCFRESSGSYIWLTGLLLREALAGLSAFDSVEEAASRLATAVFNYNLATETVRSSRGTQRGMGVAGLYRPTATTPAELLDTRIFALVNNTYLGYGHSPDRVAPPGTGSGVPAAARYPATADLRSFGVEFIGVKDVATVISKLQTAGADHVGVAVLQVPYMSPASVAANAATFFPNMDKGEVRRKVEAAIPRAMAAAEELLGPMAYMYPAFAVSPRGVSVIRPRAEVVGAHTTSGADWAAAYTRPGSMGLVVGLDLVAADQAAMNARTRYCVPVAPVLATSAGLTPVSAIDSVPVGNLFGGLSAGSWDTGARGSSLTSSRLRGWYAAAMVGVSGLPPQGAMSLEQYQSALGTAAASSPGQCVVKTRLPDWDAYGAGPSLAVLVMANAIQANSTIQRVDLAGAYPTLFFGQKGASGTTAAGTLLVPPRSAEATLFGRL